MQKRPKLHDSKVTRKFVTVKEVEKHAARNVCLLLNLNFGPPHWKKESKIFGQEKIPRVLLRSASSIRSFDQNYLKLALRAKCTYNDVRFFFRFASFVWKKSIYELLRKNFNR